VPIQLDPGLIQALGFAGVIGLPGRRVPQFLGVLGDEQLESCVSGQTLRANRQLQVAGRLVFSWMRLETCCSCR
jgi:hypothetical protein